jgi:gas vesicle protein
MSKGKFAIGAFFGAIAGVVAGVLTAPKSGKETRASIKAKSEDLKVEAEAKINEAKLKAIDLEKRTKQAALGAKEGFTSEK